jgi:hypothetical protein
VHELASDAAKAMTESVEAPVTASEEKPMIEAHAPHHPVTTWKEVFIHIGIVTLGLLIAISLEQTVEYFHHRHQVAETRAALLHERQINIIRFQAATAEMRRLIPLMQSNLRTFNFIKAHPGTPPEKWPDKLHLFSSPTVYSDSEWVTAQASNVLQYMPQSEVRKLDVLYMRLNLINATNVQMTDEKRESFSCFIENPDAAHMTNEQVESAIHHTTESLVLYGKETILMSRLADANPEFTGGPKLEEFYGILNISPDLKDSDDVLKNMEQMALKEKALGGEPDDGSK